MNNFKYIIDGYGFAPFADRGMSFIPQMFNRPRKYPFGLHTFVFHVMNSVMSIIKNLRGL